MELRLMRGLFGLTIIALIAAFLWYLKRVFVNFGCLTVSIIATPLMIHFNGDLVGGLKGSARGYVAFFVMTSLLILKFINIWIFKVVNFERLAFKV